jgi:hypothetical protein
MFGALNRTRCAGPPCGPATVVRSGDRRGAAGRAVNRMGLRINHVVTASLSGTARSLAGRTSMSSDARPAGPGATG